MGKPIRAILLIADINGYTPFVREHAVAAHHAALITTRLLKALADEAGRPLQLVEVEGDALFFLLKCSGSVGAFVRMTDAAYHIFGKFYGLTPEQAEERIEDIGIRKTLVFDVSLLLTSQAREPDRSSASTWHEKFEWWFKLHPQTLLALIRGRLREIPAGRIPSAFSAPRKDTYGF